MILKQEFEFLNDTKGTVRVHNTFDIQTAIEAAKEATANGGRSGSGSNEIVSMGFIPPEMWMYDPWLMTADKARKHGDMGEYTKNMKKFFEVHREFAPIVRKKLFAVKE
jgi:hypothetical protein